MNDITVRMPVPETWLDGSSDKQLIDSVMGFLAQDADGGMSHFQITHFVLNDKEFPTVGAKYFQARREMFVRYQNLVNQHWEHQKVLAEAEIKRCTMEDHVAEAGVGDLSEREKRFHTAKAKLASVEHQQLMVRADFIQMEAKRQIRELKAFWDNHQYYGQMLKPGVNRELTEPEHWLTKTKIKGKTAKDISQHLAGPFQSHREAISGAFLKDDILRVQATSPKEQIGG